MVRLTRLNGTEMFLNADLIATVESRPDTVVTLVDGKHFVVREHASEVVDLVTRYRALLISLADRFTQTDADASADQQQTGHLYVLRDDRTGD